MYILKRKLIMINALPYDINDSNEIYKHFKLY